MRPPRSIPTALLLSILLATVAGCSSNQGGALKQGVDMTRQFSNELKTDHFVFYSGNDVSGVPEIARFSEGFIELVNREFLRAKLPQRLGVYLLKDGPAFQEFLRETVGIDDPPNFGIYIPDVGGIVTFPGSGYGTLTHEILHPIVQAALPQAPSWVDEGLPSFFEKFFGYWDGENLVLHLGYQNPWRIEELSDTLTGLELERIVKRLESAHGFGNASEERLVAVFLYKQGLLEKFIELVETNKKDGFNDFVEAAFGRSLADIEPLWRDYLQEIETNRNDVLAIPASKVLSERESFLRFMRAQGMQEDPRRHVSHVLKAAASVFRGP